MNRCTRSRAKAALAAVVAGLFLSFTFTAASAQGIRREAPKDVLLGQLQITAPPEVILDGKIDRLSPGSRIRDLNNMLLMSGSVVGQILPVVYRRDAAGLVHEVWVLSADEYSKLSGVQVGTSAFFDLLAIIFGARR